MNNPYDNKTHTIDALADRVKERLTGAAALLA
ncbi:MAG: hypothetical protein FD130_1304, partial [Halothiobacillaceae bacterium]